LHKDFGRFVAVFIKHAHNFHLFSTFQRRRFSRRDTARPKGEFQLVFEDQAE